MCFSKRKATHLRATKSPAVKLLWVTKLNTVRSEATAGLQTIPVINSTKAVGFSTSQVLLVLALVRKLAVKSMHYLVQQVHQLSCMISPAKFSSGN